ncbi:MAG: cysteine desulfurase family protein [Candidatus Pacebacteria bacterium]|nr:cysteine desulfurase family protein [Candidatus Paceibacterota bacterium]
MAEARVYLDYAATTPLDPRVAAAMEPFWFEQFGNPHSGSHVFGWEAEEAVIAARQQIAESIGVSPREIIFTSGATEANNLSLIGLARGLAEGAAGQSVILSSATEHPSVTEPIGFLQDQGFDPYPLTVTTEGEIDCDRLPSLSESVATIILAVMAVNSETGVVQPIAKIRQAVVDHYPWARVFLQVDAAQAMGRIAVTPLQWGADLVSLSAHKFYGPSGVGAVYIKAEIQGLIQPLSYGGGQEKSLRPGSLPVPLIVGMATAAAIAGMEGPTESLRIAALRQGLLAQLWEAGIVFKINGNGVPAIVNLQLPGMVARDLLAGLPNFALSLGSACHHAELTPSPVLLAMGLSPTEALSSFRLCLGRTTTAEDLNRLVQELVGILPRAV